MGKFLKVVYTDMGRILDFWKTDKRTLGNCTRCGRFGYMDPHHLVTRSRGGKDTVNVCRTCHNWIGEHISKAECEGFYLRGYKGEKN